MRIAILSVTAGGLAVAEEISARLGGEVFAGGREFNRLADFVAEIFGKFDALVFICATGIAVRVIAAHVVSKLSDPAVIVVDERGRNVISLLSGHVGGGNDLTLKIASALGANPVITTATDVAGKVAIDGLAGKLGLKPEPKDAIKAINSAVLRDEPVYLVAGGVRLNLVPQKLIAGIGCRRGVSAEKIAGAVAEACAEIGQSTERISVIRANPVITTATDVEGKVAIDGLAGKLGLKPEPKDAIKAINSAVLRDEPVYLVAGGVRLNLVPQKLIAGIGCRRGVSAEKIAGAIAEACAEIGQSTERISVLASVELKRDEAGLLAFAESLGVEIKFFSVEELAKKIAEYKLSESKFVKAALGAGNVCEAAALCCVEAARFALPKKSFGNGVTVALVWEK